MLNVLTRRRRRRVPADTMPAIVFAGDCFDAWIEHMRPAAEGHWVVQLTFADGRTRDATVTAAGGYGAQSLAGLEVVFWDGDQDPPLDAPREIVYSTEITKVSIY